MILIVGSSGHLGRATALRLLAQGKPVRLMSRNPAALNDLEKRGAEVVRGDLRDLPSLKDACRGIDQVVAAAHALNGKGDNNPHTVDDLGNRRLIDAAKDAGVKQFVFISIQNVAPDSFLEFFRIKYAIEEYLRASGLGYTILRPMAFMDLWGEMIGQPIIEKGKATTFGSGNNPINFVAVEDLARLIEAVLEDERTLNQSYDVCGPENLTMNQVTGIFQGLAGRPAQIQHVPLPMLRVLSVVMPPFNPMMGRLIRNSVYVDTAKLTCEGSGIPQGLPAPKTRFEDWARSFSAPAARVLA